MGRDSNPRYLAVHTLSRRAQSTALAPILGAPDFGTSNRSFQPKSITPLLRAEPGLSSSSRPDRSTIKKTIMPAEPLIHATLVFERICAAPVARVFAALANPVERASWGTPSGNATLVCDETDFRVGGHDIFRCGSKADPEYRGVTTYYDIVPGQRIISSEIMKMGDVKLLISMSTTVLAAEKTGTKVTVTIQLISLGGDDMLGGAETGYNASLDNLAKAVQ